MDNTGKTTLVKKIGYDLGLETRKSPGPAPANEMFKWVEEQINDFKGGGTIVYDRFAAVTDQVYGPLLRKQNPFKSEVKGRYLLQTLGELNPLIVYCRPSRIFITSFEDGREQMKGVEDNAYELLEGYDNLVVKMVDQGFEVIVYNFEAEGSYQYLLSNIKEHLNKGIKNYKREERY